MQTLVAGGATAGSDSGSSFFVKCDAETNPPDVRAAGMAIATIGIALTTPAEFIVLNVKRTTRQRLASMKTEARMTGEQSRCAERTIRLATSGSRSNSDFIQAAGVQRMHRIFAAGDQGIRVSRGRPQWVFAEISRHWQHWHCYAQAWHRHRHGFRSAVWLAARCDERHASIRLTTRIAVRRTPTRISTARWPFCLLDELGSAGEALASVQAVSDQVGGPGAEGRRQRGRRSRHWNSPAKESNSPESK